MEKLCFKNFMVDIKAVFASFAGSGGPNCAAARDAKSIKSWNENGCRAHHPALAGATTTFASWAKSRQWPSQWSQQSHSYSAKIGVSSSWASGNNKSLIWEQHWFSECYGSKTKSKYQLGRFQENYRRDIRSIETWLIREKHLTCLICNPCSVVQLSWISTLCEK